MPTQSNINSHGLWEKKTYLSAAVSILITGAVAFAVCAARGDTLVLGQAAPVSVSHVHTASSTGGK